MALKSKRKEQDDPKLDMTPMIDVVFQLMIFFVVTLKQEDIYSMLLANAPAPSSGAADPTAPQPLKIDLGPVENRAGKIMPGRYAYMTMGQLEVGATRDVDSRDIETEAVPMGGRTRQVYRQEEGLLLLKSGTEGKYAGKAKQLRSGRWGVEENMIMFKAGRGLRDKLKNAEKDQLIVITCANDSPHSLLLDVLNVCTSLGMRNVNVMSFQNNLQSPR